LILVDVAHLEVRLYVLVDHSAPLAVSAAC